MRTNSIKSINEQKFKTYEFTGIWQRAFGTPERHGAWLVWGSEKNGKTWFALMLAGYLSTFDKVLYISGEEGCGRDFVAACRRAGLRAEDKNVKVVDYVPLDELDEFLLKRKSPKIIILDNLTIYNEEMKYGRFKDLISKHKDKLFIFIAHEEKKEVYTSTGKMCKRLAKIIVYVQGLAAQVSGRCPGGIMTIDQEKAQLYWGTEITA